MYGRWCARRSGGSSRAGLRGITRSGVVAVDGSDSRSSPNESAGPRSVIEYIGAARDVAGGGAQTRVIEQGHQAQPQSSLSLVFMVSILEKVPAGVSASLPAKPSMLDPIDRHSI